MFNIFDKLRRIWGLVRCSYNPTTEQYVVHKWLYPSYWHAKLSTYTRKNVDAPQYFTATPNPGAGIGHQMANWHAGLWWSWQFGMKHAHIPFSQISWEHLLNYGSGDPTIHFLKSQGYKLVHLPFFYEDRPDELKLIHEIISSYKGKKVVFIAEQDQSYPAQCGVKEYVRDKFYKSPYLDRYLTPFRDDFFCVAVHLRRGDIVAGQINGDHNLMMRWLSNDYYTHVLDNILPLIRSSKPVHIYIFSQGKESDFPELQKYKNIHFYLNLNAESTFLSFVYADLLITSKSSFSYKPALLNKKGIKVCPANFWHAYPEEQDWILMNDEGNFLRPNEVPPIC